MSIKVSIIVPVYNVEPYLSKCMESLCNQSLQDIEIIAINDCSQDDSLKILKRYAKHDKRIKIINKKKNVGTANARNSGCSIATGEYIAFIDGDDYVDKDFYEKLYKLAVKNNADVAKGVTKTFNVDGSVVIAKDNDDIVKQGKFAFMGHLLTAIYKNNLIKENNIRFYIDFFCFQIQVVYFANKIVCLNDTFYNYVRHIDSCDSDIFTLEKWQRLNLGHGNFMYDWIMNHSTPSDIKILYLDRIKSLYFYGFNKLELIDVPLACRILASTMKKNYDCGFNIADDKSFIRKLYRKNKNTTLFTYIIDVLKGRI